jgi:hypothetical protein
LCRASGLPSLFTKSVSRLGGSGWRGITVLRGAVLVRVIAPEEHVPSFGRDDAVVPADGSGGGVVAKVFLDEGGLEAVEEEVGLGLLGELDSLLEGAGELVVESDIARRVDGEGGGRRGGGLLSGVDGGSLSGPVKQEGE